MAKHFIGVESYEISPEWKAPQRKRSSMALGLVALYVIRKYRSSSKKKKSGSSGGRRISSQVRDTRQRCTVKMHYSKSMEAHKEQINRYLVKEGKGKDGVKPELYGTPEAEYRKNMVNKNFRIFLSPASASIPLEALTKTFVSSLEAQHGYKLYWVASEHYDTAHHHVHLLINGTDKNGRDVFFPPDQVKTFMRENARNICTALAGSRTKEDMAREKEGLLTANRYTYLDEQIKERMKDNCFTVKAGRESESILRRLDHLRFLELCRFENNKFIFTQTWEKTLKTNGRYNAFLSARKTLKYTNEQNLKLYDGSQGNVSGVITKIFKTDEVSDNHAVLLESIDGNAYFIPLFWKPNIKGGETVEIEAVKNQRGRLTPQTYKRTKEELLAQCEAKDYRKGYAVFLKDDRTANKRTGIDLNL
jgi:type IV secretory pathway VirD2 relaxase